MALIKLYEAVNPTVLYGLETFGGLFTSHGWYSVRYDCALYLLTSNSFYKIFRDGTAVRVCGNQGFNNINTYDLDLDLWMSNFSYGVDSPTWYYNDPIGLKYDPGKLSPLTFGPVGLGASSGGVIWHGEFYHASGGVIRKRQLNGTLLTTISTTGSLSFSADTLDITPDGILVAIDFTNGTRGVVRFYSLHTGTTLYESTIDPAKWVWVDRDNKNIWSVSTSTGKMQVWSFDVAPATFSAITLGGNRSRYREDAASVTLRGSDNELVRNWPVKWTLSTSEGHLKETVTLTGTDGVATNTYCGPGVDDYVGGSQAITVETGY